GGDSGVLRRRDGARQRRAGGRWLMAVFIDLEPCINCGLCRRACPTETIKYFSTGRRTHVVEPAGCIDCDICVQICPERCIHRDEEYEHEPEELAAARAKAKVWASRQNQQRRQLKARAAAAIAALR